MNLRVGEKYLFTTYGVGKLEFGVGANRHKVDTFVAKVMLIRGSYIEMWKEGEEYPTFGVIEFMDIEPLTDLIRELV